MNTPGMHNKSDQSDQSDQSNDLHRLLPKHGGYEKLRGFQVALAVYDATLLFCDRFVEKRSRTHDQMVQAARSGARNIAEGSMASGTSKKTELKLTNVARASLDELMGDYKDFLRQRGLPIWDKEDPRALAVRRKYCSENRPETADVSDPFQVRVVPPEVAANTLLCLVNQATYLIHRQLLRLERDFLEHGGFTERLYAVRNQFRKQSDPSDRSDRSDRSDPSDRPPGCPKCGQPMRRRTARRGPRAGQTFWGCNGYPDCRGTRLE